MLNEKGLVVSSILYTLLIAFLLFLGVTLSTFQASSRLISNSNKDLINGTQLTATAIQLDDACDDDSTWFNTPYLIKINSRYGTSYWPRDYGLSIAADGAVSGDATAYKGKISFSFSPGSPSSFSDDTNMEIVFVDLTTAETKTVTISGSCPVTP